MNLFARATIDVPADELWALVAHRFADVGVWASSIRSSSASVGTDAPAQAAPVSGRVCETGLAIAPSVTETITAYDEAAKTLTYEGSGLPRFVVLARNTWQVREHGPRRAQISMDAELELRSLGGRLLALPLRIQLWREGRRMLADLKHYAETGEPSGRKRRQLARQQPSTSEVASRER